jgi:hypothetical protein
VNLRSLLKPSQGQVDWLFVGFVACAVLGSSFAGAQRVRYGRAMQSFASCAAAADARCAAPALETLRAIDPANVRTELAQAEMRALAGEADLASSLLVHALRLTPPPPGVRRNARPVGGVQLLAGPAKSAPTSFADIEPETLAKLPSEVRGDVLVLAGDIAALRGDVKQADALWTEAAGIIDEALVEPRRERATSKKDATDARLSGELAAIQDDFEKLFDESKSGSDGASYAATALRTRVQNVSPQLARQKMTLSIDAADRCAKMVRIRRLSQNAPTLGGWTRPSPPIAPSEADMAKNSWMRSNYERELAQYRQSVQRWDEQQNDKSKARYYAESEITASANDILAEARSLLKEGLALAAADGPHP